MERVNLLDEKQMNLLEMSAAGLTEIMDSYCTKRDDNSNECNCPTIGCHNEVSYMDRAFLQECKRQITETRGNIERTNDQLQTKACLSLYFYCWKHLHDLKWDLVDLHYRYAFECASLNMSIYTVTTSSSAMDLTARAIKILDMGLIHGARGPCYNHLVQYASHLHATCKESSPLAIGAPVTWKKCDYSCVRKNPPRPIDMKHLAINLENHIPVDTYAELDLITFHTQYLAKNKPVLMKNAINDWPAVQKWSNLEYIRNMCGHRYVPVEIGGYLEENAKSTIISIHDYIDQYIENRNCHEPIGYLAQHCLFDQIDELRRDIIVPDYCSLLNEDDRKSNSEDVIINAWFGPIGCKSPLHHDPYHNLLVQVCGYKFIRLFSPSESQYLRPRRGKFYNNSSIDIEDSCQGREVVRNAKYSDVLLEPGDMLFVPRWYWHFVASVSTLTDSVKNAEYAGVKRKSDNEKQNEEQRHVFSVSFWWGERKEKKNTDVAEK